MESDTNPNAISEMSDNEVAKVLIAELQQMKDPERMLIIHGGESITVAQLIDHLQQKTPEGLYHVKLYREAHQTLAEMDSEKDETPGIGTRIKRAIQQLLS